MSCLIVVHRQLVFSMIVFGYLYKQNVFSLKFGCLYVVISMFWRSHVFSRSYRDENILLLHVLLACANLHYLYD